MKARLSTFGAFTVLIGACIALFAFVIQPLAQWRSDQVAGLGAAETEFTRLSEAKSRLLAEAESFGDATTDALLWTSIQPGELYARIQARLTDAAAQSGLSFRSITPLPIQKGDAVDEARVRIEFEADLGQLSQFLRDIEYATPALPVSKATLRRLVRPNETSVLPVLFSQIEIAAPVLIGDGQ